MGSLPDIPVATHGSRSSIAARSNGMFFVRIGGVSFYTINDYVVVRVQSKTEEYFYDTPSIVSLFPGVKITSRVGQAEIKFHLVRLLGEQGYETVMPLINDRLGE